MWRSKIEYLPYMGATKLFLANSTSEKRTVLTDMVWTDIPEGKLTEDDDVCTIHDEAMLQALMDALWDTGLRPTNGPSDKQELNAVKSHLSDMKEIAYHVLKVGK